VSFELKVTFFDLQLLQYSRLLVKKVSLLILITQYTYYSCVQFLTDEEQRFTITMDNGEYGYDTNLF
jgi:hypothetical protein